GITGQSAARALRRQGRGDLLGRRGFAAMSPERRRELASIGGKAAHALSRAHEFTSEEAAAAGAEGGKAAQAKGTAHVFTAETARAARRKSGRKRRGAGG